MLTPWIGICGVPLTALRLGQARGLEHGRRDIDHVMPLRAHFVLRLDALRPMHDQAVARAAVVRGDLLRPGEGRVARHRPAGGVVVVGVGAAKLVDMLQDVGDVLGDAD